jgi:hypothetical protein
MKTFSERAAKNPPNIPKIILTNIFSFTFYLSNAKTALLLATQGGSSQFTKLEFSPNERE